jgi:hypothetical protein
VIPGFESSGNLPPGIHEALLDEVRVRYATNLHRRRLFLGLQQVVADLQAAGCRRIYVDGSFVTSKRTPKDFDCCWEPAGVNLDLLPPELSGYVGNRRAAQQARYMGDIFPADSPEDELAANFLGYFQRDKRTGEAKGIIAINL